MNYKIIGSDKQEYGPISLEQLRQWAQEGRVNAETLVQPEGAADWKPLSAYPELMPLTVPATSAPSFTPPASASGFVSGDASNLINGPATGLLITGILGAVGAAGGLLMNVLGVGAGAFQAGRGGNAAAERLINVVAGGAGIVSSLVHIALAALIIYGALQMKKLVNYKLAMATAIIALAPCVSPCCLVGLPVGIWALVMLNKPEVKSAFH
jgi:hypothetical protein